MLGQANLSQQAHTFNARMFAGQLAKGWPTPSGHHQLRHHHHHHYAQTISRATNLLQHNRYPNQYSMSPLQQASHLAPTSPPQQRATNQARMPPPLQAINNYNYYPIASGDPAHPDKMGYQQPQQQQQQQQHLPRRQLHQYQHQDATLIGLLERQALLNRPLCRCRVMYLGSSVPHITKNGLHGIQEPLRLLYPEEQFAGSKPAPAGNMQELASATIDISHLSASLGIDSWLSVWSNGLLLENVDEFGREVKRFFSIDTLHYCAAVRFFDTSTLVSQQQQDKQKLNLDNVQSDGQDQNNNVELASQSDSGAPDRKRKGAARFLPLDAPLFQCPGMVDPKHPPVFAAIMRRTSGVKVLECHAFICRRDAASNALVRCCTQAYADLLNAKRLSAELSQQHRPLSMHRRAASLAPTRKSNSGNDCSDRSNEDEELCSASAGSSNENNNNNMRPVTRDNCSSSPEANYAIISRASEKRPIGRKLSKPSRKERGSSKSLYDDFMPKYTIGECREPGCCATETESQRNLSHSLELIQPIGGENCCASGEDDICYAVAKNKRHSRSMQELEGPFEFTVPSESGTIRSSRRREHSSSKSSSRRQHQQDKPEWKKAQSYQDMRSQRKSSVSSFLHQQDSSANNRVEPQPEVCPEIEGHYEKVTPTADRRSTSKHRSSRRSGSRGADSGTSRRRRKSGDASGLLEGYQAPNNRNNYHYQQPSMVYHPAINYMHPSSYYMSHAYGPPIGHPQLHQQPLYGPPPTFYDAYHHHHPGQPNGAHYMPPYGHYPVEQFRLIPNPQYQSQTISARRSRDTAGKSHALATRFRCLSPPLNFLKRTQEHHNDQSAPPTSSKTVDTAATKPLEAPTATGSTISEMNVVSGEPAFSNSNTMRRMKKMSWIKRLSLTMSTSSHFDRPEQGLTSGHESDSGTLTGRPLSSDPSGSQQQQRQEEQQQQVDAAATKKKRSSIFSGSLTLGRIKRDSRLETPAT